MWGITCCKLVHCDVLSVTVHLNMQAYDQHLNMILGDVEETITSIEIDDETYEEIVKVCHGCDFLHLLHALAQPI